MKLNRLGFKIDKSNKDYDIRQIKRDLSIKPNVPKGYGPPPKPFAVYTESDNSLYIPKFFGLDLNKSFITLKDKSTNVNIEFNGKMRDYQEKIRSQVHNTLKKDKRTVLCLPTGYGKTALGLKILSDLKKKTLIVVHTKYLLTQWIERIKQFLPEARIGYFYGSKCDVEDKDIIIGMLQSLSLKEYSLDLFKDVGFTIVDECHHISAQQFSKALFRISSFHMLGLSATPYRADGLTKLLYWHFGTILNPMKNHKINQDVHIDIIPYKPTIFKEVKLRYGGYNFANMTNQLCNDEKRNEIIIDKIIEFSKEERNILVLSARIEHIKYISDKLNFLNISSGIFIGGMKSSELDNSTTKQVICATYNMFKEGVDVPKLNTLIFATPIVNITQAVGRILRKIHEDNHALVIDIWDRISQFERWGVKRQKQYKTKKFIVNNIEEECDDDLDVDDDEKEEIEYAFSDSE